MEVLTKNFGDAYLYSKGSYARNLTNFLIEGEKIDRSHPSFEDIRYEVKRRQKTSTLSTILDSDNVILIRREEPLPKALKVFAAKDIKHPNDKSLYVYIDVSEIIKPTGDGYKLVMSVDVLISYLISAMNMLIYYRAPKLILGNARLNEYGAKCYSSLVKYVIDYLRIGSVDNCRSKVAYMASLFYFHHMMGNEITEAIRAKALKISGLSDKEASIVDFQTDQFTYNQLDNFINAMKVVIKADKLTVDVFVNKWIFLYQTGTQFATELYVALATMITNAYAGAYLNNQSTIEKVLGPDLVEFSNTLFTIGRDI